MSCFFWGGERGELLAGAPLCCLPLRDDGSRALSLPPTSSFLHWFLRTCRPSKPPHWNNQPTNQTNKHSGTHCEECYEGVIREEHGRATGRRHGRRYGYGGYGYGNGYGGEHDHYY